VGDDPANIYSSGQRVGRDSNNSGIFTGLFRSGATGVKYDRSVFQYFRGNGDLVLTTRWTDTAGNTDYDNFMARMENGVLKFVGNGYAYPATVAATVQDRDYINLPDYSYMATGYGITIPVNSLTAGVARVLVTTPLGTNLEFRPAPGNANMTIYRNGASTFAPSIRLAAAWRNPAKSGNPSDWDLNQVFASPQYGEEQLRALPDQSVWVLEFRDSGDNVLATQSYRTYSRGSPTSPPRCAWRSRAARPPPAPSSSARQMRRTRTGSTSAPPAARTAGSCPKAASRRRPSRPTAPSAAGPSQTRSPSATRRARSSWAACRTAAPIRTATTAPACRSTPTACG
jgi:hypothetical protein